MSVSFQASPFASPPAHAYSASPIGSGGGGGGGGRGGGGGGDGVDTSSGVVVQLITMQAQCRHLIDHELYDSGEKLGALWFDGRSSSGGAA